MTHCYYCGKRIWFKMIRGKIGADNIQPFHPSCLSHVMHITMFIVRIAEAIKSSKDDKNIDE